MPPSRRTSARLTEGPIVRGLLALAGPIVLANLFQTVYQLTDTFWVGRLGVEAVAAVSLSFPVLFFLISVGGGLGIAGTILVAQYDGAGEAKRVNHVSAQTLLVSVAASIPLAVVGFTASRPVLRAMGAAPDVLPLATEYLQYSFAGLVFLFGYFVFQSLMRGVGDVRTPATIVFGTVLLNFVLDPLFIQGWGPVPALGVAGAALATLATQGLAAVIGVAVLFSGRYGIQIRAADFRPDWALQRRLVRLGFPASVEQSTRALGLTVMTVLVAGFGSAVVAAYGVGVRVISFVIIPALGLSMATSTLVGQNIGAGRVDRSDRVAKVGTLVGFLGMSAAGLVGFVFAEPIVRAFIPGQPAVIADGTQFLRVVAPTFGLIGVQQVLSGVFRGAGHTFISMVLAIVALWVFRFPIAYLLSERTALGPDGLWWAFPLSNVLAAAVALVWFWRGTWKRPSGADDVLTNRVRDEVEIEEGRPQG